MRIRMRCAIALIAFSTSGCDGLGLNPEAKINAAFPLDDSISKSKTETLKQLPAEKQEVLENEYAHRLKLRALSCSKGYSPSWFASAEQIRSSLTDRTCFAEADASIARWLGLFQVGILLAQPPLKPIPDNPPKFLLADSHITNAHFARNAGVGLFELHDGIQIVELGTGKTILKDKKTGYSQNNTLSSNGRVFATGSGSGMKISSVETGQILIDMPNVRLDQFHWLGEEAALYRRDREKTFLADFLNAKEVPLTAVQDHVGRTLETTNKSEFLIGGNRTLLKIRIDRSGKETSVTLLEEKKISNGWGTQSSGVTVDGTRFFNANRELTLISLASMEAETISFDPYFMHVAVATADPDKLILSGVVQNLSSSKRQCHVFSISQRTVTAVDMSAFSSERFIFVTPLKRIGVFGGQKIELIDNLPTAETQSLENFVASAVAQQNQAIIDSYDRQQMGSGSYRGSGSISSMPGLSTAPLANLAKDAKIEAIGIYEAGNAPRTSDKDGRRGSVLVRVRRSEKPIVIVLSSYEPVRWTLAPEPGAQIAAVLLSGYHLSEVFGAGSARVVMAGSHYPYKSGDYGSLDREVYRLTGKRIDLFQGLYKGASFSVGGNL